MCAFQPNAFQPNAFQVGGQAGKYSLLHPWLNVGGITPTIQAGKRSLVHPVLDVGIAPLVTQAGKRSLFHPCLGMGAFPTSPPLPIDTVAGYFGRGRRWPYEQLRHDDQDLIEILAIILQSGVLDG